MATIEQPGAAATYRETVAAAWPGSAIWDYLRYDEAGDLWLNGLCVPEAARRLGTPLEIVDTTIAERRCRQWVALTRSVAAEHGYPGRLGYLYAAKANMASEVTHAAYRSGWGAETSSTQDLRHLEWLERHDLLPAGIRIVCNGFKLPRAAMGGEGAAERRNSWRERPAGSGPAAAGNQSGPAQSGAEVQSRSVAAPVAAAADESQPRTYAESIVAAARRGWNICPILDQGELATFAAPGTPEMDVGLRLRCGQACTLEELDSATGRFGMDRHEVAAAAEAVARAPHLRLTTLHTMISAADTLPVDVYAASLLVAARAWAELGQRHPTLTELNLGGGIPPLSEPYAHERLLTALFSGLSRLSADAGLPPPDVTFELGSLVAAECGCHVFRVVQIKDVGGNEGRVRWALLDGGLMAAIPDMLIIGKPFRFLAASGADRPVQRVVFGDLTCDSDGRYPPRAAGPGVTVLLPDGEDDLYVLIQGVGAYQETLSGVRGAHHCGLLEAIELIVESAPDGGTHTRLMPRQTSADAAAILGYAEAAVPALAGALRAARSRSTEEELGGE